MRSDVAHLVQYKLPRHQVLAIRKMARESHVRPSDILQFLVEQALTQQLDTAMPQVQHGG